MFPNMLVVALAALVSLVMGFIYYHPKVFGTAWMKASGLTMEQLKSGGSMAKIFIVTYILSFMAAMMLFTLVVHQTHYYSILIDEVGFGVDGSDLMNQIAAFMDSYGNNFRTFKHGALHGTIVGIFIALPIIMINGLFEKKSMKYGFINAFYWIICFAIMGGILCQWG